jgi:hypothetical protein
LLLEGRAQLRGGGGDLRHHCIDLAPQQGGAQGDRANEAEHHDRRSEGARHPPLLDEVDDRVERVKNQHREDHREQDRRGELHHQDDGAGRQYPQGHGNAPQVPRRRRFFRLRRAGDRLRRLEDAHSVNPRDRAHSSVNSFKPS